jgi:hypothetical protein
MDQMVCFAHLRWDFVFQRPQHLMTRFAKDRQVIFVEEPHFDAQGEATLAVEPRQGNLAVAVPHLPPGTEGEAVNAQLRNLVDKLFSRLGRQDPILWYYTPMALSFTSHLRSSLTVYDCMDELSAFNGAPPALVHQEERLVAKADLVFTGGESLYQAKRGLHPRVYAFPSSIDRGHFLQARQPCADPEDQDPIPGPRIGYYGVIDERIDLDLLAQAAEVRPDWSWVMIGPVCKIHPDSLPRRRNIHYLGQKDYRDLPRYLSGWDAAMMPFARNRATRFISPTKTPEYLTGGKPVVSTSIRDVVNPYGLAGLVHIGDSARDFVRGCEAALARSRERGWLQKVDAFLAGNTWDATFGSMNGLIASLLSEKQGNRERAVADQVAGRLRHV